MKEPPDLTFLPSVLVVLPCSYEPDCSSDPAMMPYSGLLPCTMSSDSSVVVIDHGPLYSISSSLWVRSDAFSGSMALLFLCQTVPCSSFIAIVLPCTTRPLRHSLFVLFWARFSGMRITHALFYHILSLNSFSPSGCELLRSSLCLWLALTYPFQTYQTREAFDFSKKN
ncbi:hypothetical protein Cgig2_010295 [Carnegiea gigantea]|uniref:Uncharacterized protein n=1 Tax=Carnegiea gigantea TaxID=171969 RepID=A0A9Q1KGG4_9CARY|nr:hypothetical protein Cgig2_010295 [Carnegiea gigantea]